MRGHGSSVKFPLTRKWEIQSPFLKRNEEDMGNYRAESATSVPSKIMEKILLKTVLMHKENKEVNGNIQDSFLKHKS